MCVGLACHTGLPVTHIIPNGVHQLCVSMVQPWQLATISSKQLIVLLGEAALVGDTGQVWGVRRRPGSEKTHEEPTRVGSGAADMMEGACLASGHRSARLGVPHLKVLLQRGGS